MRLHEVMAIFRQEISVKAIKTNYLYPNACIMATTDGFEPSQRVVLAKHIDDTGLVIYTGLKSRKAVDLSYNNRVSLTFYYDKAAKAAVITGRAYMLPDIEVSTYWMTRGRVKQAVSSASNQSQVMPSLLLFYFRIFGRMFWKEIKKPPLWGGFKVIPDSVEILNHSDFRINKRKRYERIFGTEDFRVVNIYP